MTNLPIRAYVPEDLEAIKRLTIESFTGVTLEQNVENALGLLHGHDWCWRKARHIDEDVVANPSGIFVANSHRRVVGYISTRVDRESGKGRIPNLAVAQEFRGCGLGRRLIEHALNYFRSEGLEYATIETMAENEIGQHLYPACGFVEVRDKFTSREDCKVAVTLRVTSLPAKSRRRVVQRDLPQLDSGRARPYHAQCVVRPAPQPFV